MQQTNISNNINKAKPQDQDYQFLNKKWGYLSMKFVENKNQQLQMKFIEKINSVKMQLHIASSIVEKQNNNKRDNILQIDHSESQELNKKYQKQQTRQQQRLKNSISSSSTFETKSINQSQLKSNPLLTILTKHLYSIQMLLSQINKTQQTLSIQLLKNQTQIQQKLQQKQYLSQIQKKIQDMRYVLINKQNEIATENLGGFNDLQLKTSVIKNFNNRYLDMCNIRNMCNKLCQLKRYLKQFCNNKLHSYKILYERNINQEKYCQIRKSKQIINRMYDKQNKLQINIRHKYSDESKNIRNDTISPVCNQFSKQMLQMFKNQLKRQRKLLAQNRKLQQKLNNLKQQHIKLNCRYRHFYMK